MIGKCTKSIRVRTTSRDKAAKKLSEFTPATDTFTCRSAFARSDTPLASNRMRASAGYRSTIQETLAVSSPKPNNPSATETYRIVVVRGVRPPEPIVTSHSAEIYKEVNRRAFAGGVSPVLVENCSGNPA